MATDHDDDDDDRDNDRDDDRDDDDDNDKAGMRLLPLAAAPALPPRALRCLPLSPRSLVFAHSTVTVLARFRGLSTSSPRAEAM